MPVADSTKAPEVVVPNSGESAVASASAIMGRSICGRLPCSSRKPARARESDQRAHGVHKGHDEDGERDGQRLGRERAAHVELRKDGRDAGGSSEERRGPGRNARGKGRKRGDDDADQNCAGNLADHQRAHQQESEDGHQHRSRGERARLDRRARNAKLDDAGLVQSDEGEKQSDADGEAVAQRGGDGFHQPLAQAQHGEQNEGESGEKDRAQRGLPANAQAKADGEGDECVFAHVGRDGEGPVGVEAHQQAAANRRQNRRRHRGAGGNARRLQDRRIDHDDVGHGGEGRDAGENLAAEAGAARLDLEELAKSVQWSRFLHLLRLLKAEFTPSLPFPPGAVNLQW